MQVAEESKKVTDFRQNKRKFFKDIDDVLKEYQGTLIPYLPEINKKIIAERLNKESNFLILIIELKALWPLQFLLQLDDPSKARGQWLFTFCKSLKILGQEKILKESANKTIYDFIMKDNIEIFKHVKRELRRDYRIKAKIRKSTRLDIRTP